MEFGQQLFQVDMLINKRMLHLTADFFRHIFTQDKQLCFSHVYSSKAI